MATPTLEDLHMAYAHLAGQLAVATNLAAALGRAPPVAPATGGARRGRHAWIDGHRSRPDRPRIARPGPWPVPAHKAASTAGRICASNRAARLLMPAAAPALR
jgi:hypothetical protein